MSLNPLTLLRKGAEWLNEKPESQWTLGSFIANSKLGQALHIPSMTLPMPRMSRFCERVVFAKMALLAAPLILAHPLALPIVLPILFQAKVISTIAGASWWPITKGVAFVLNVTDQAVNGLDEYREGEKHAKNMKKLRKQMAKGQQQMPEGPFFKEADDKPSLVDRLIALGQVFNSKSGQRPGGFIPQQGPVGGQDPLGPAIWGTPTTSTTNQYEQPFQIPDVNTVRIASEGRESVQQHNLHYGPQPTTHHHHQPNPGGGDGC